MDMVGDGNSTNAGGRQNPPATNVFLPLKLRSALRNTMISKSTKSNPVRDLFRQNLDTVRDRAVVASTIFTTHPPAMAGTPFNPRNFDALRKRAQQIQRNA